MDKDLLDRIGQLVEKNSRDKLADTLTNRYKKNLAAFDNFGMVFQKPYSEYDPKDITLSIAKSGAINLKDNINGQMIYPDDPIEFCHQQIEKYIQSPLHYHFILKDKKVQKPEHVHFEEIKYLEALTNQFINNKQDIVVDFNTVPVGLFIVNGIGLGYHISELIKQYQINNLILIENHPDIFYASLHTIDWQPILEHFSIKGRSIQFCIDLPNEKVMLNIGSLINIMGVHNRSNTFVYNHLQSQKGLQTSLDLLVNIRKLEIPDGFVEDEIISFEHTYKNMGRYPMLSSRTIQQVSYPAFIIANGPSLDDSIDFIRQHQDKAIIFSCGTALSALEHYGIKPDFHIELERTDLTTLALKKGNSEQFLKKLSCIAIQNVPPETLALFGQSFICAKACDSGTVMMQHIEPGVPQVLTITNPTVTNAATNIAIRMGFTQLYLLGVDLAYADDLQHHAKNSAYYDIENQDFQSFQIDKATRTASGNFRQQVQTTEVLYKSATMLSFLLAEYPNVNVFNLSNGIKVDRAQPLTMNDAIKPMNRLPSLDKKEVCNQLIDQNFQAWQTLKNISFEQAYQRYLKPLKDFMANLDYPKKIANIQEVYTLINMIFRNIHHDEKNNPIIFTATRGSFNQLLNLVYLICLYSDNQQQINDNYIESMKVFQSFLNEMVALINQVTHRLRDPAQYHSLNS